ncbi:hypothetical protein A7U43_14725 [Mycobacterium adipatum]|uniref:Uncharacterized protein n=2 Tax=Mycobacterium adipatum TaxID=1682113 RepID=A0A172UVD9_9MYCO|nr:hypothetical protein A7U43_14725 [Mycobacterium adipatum]
MKTMGWSTRRKGEGTATYVLTDRLQQHHAVCSTAEQITATLLTWLAQLDAHSALVEEFGRSIRHNDWAAAYAIADVLSVDVNESA